MRALQYRAVGAAPEVVEVETPVPGPGQVLLRVTAAGVCHSDQFIMDLPEDQYIYGLPLTLGHEGAGVVESWGDGVKGLTVGEPMLVYGPWGCGRCYTCAQSSKSGLPVWVRRGRWRSICLLTILVILCRSETWTLLPVCP